MVYSEKAGLLLQRMSELGLNPDAIVRTQSELFDDLERRCALCEHRDVCIADLSQRRPDRARMDYCPNSVLLNALTEVWWLRELA